MKKSIALFYCIILVITAKAQNIEIAVERDNLRPFLGTCEFSPQFRMKIFSINEKTFAQRIGDADKFQIFPKAKNVFFLKQMAAELAFTKSAKGHYDTLILHQDNRDMKAFRIASAPYELYDTIKQLDSMLYTAYNERKLPQLMQFFSPDLEFYHDITGKTNYQNNLERFSTNFKKSTKMRRVLQKGSLEVYPIEGFGAIQMGIHHFYATDNGEEKLVGQPKFMHIWKRQGKDWKIVRIVSYDH